MSVLSSSPTLIVLSSLSDTRCLVLLSDTHCLVLIVRRSLSCPPLRRSLSCPPCPSRPSRPSLCSSFPLLLVLLPVSERYCLNEPFSVDFHTVYHNRTIDEANIKAAKEVKPLPSAVLPLSVFSLDQRFSLRCSRPSWRCRRRRWSLRLQSSVSAQRYFFFCCAPALCTRISLCIRVVHPHFVPCGV